MTLLNIVKEAQELVYKTPSFKEIPFSYLSASDYLDEYKTIALKLPRRCGKTTTAKSIHRMYSSLYYNKYAPTEGFEYERAINKIRGRKFDGLKYDLIILDEYKENPKDFFPFVANLAIADLISHNFHILRLYT